MLDPVPDQAFYLSIISPKRNISGAAQEHLYRDRNYISDFPFYRKKFCNLLKIKDNGHFVIKYNYQHPLGASYYSWNSLIGPPVFRSCGPVDNRSILWGTDRDFPIDRDEASQSTTKSNRRRTHLSE